MDQKTELKVAQDRETPLQRGGGGPFTWRYAYARAADTRLANDPGQDYITFRQSDTVFAFALCDGVSQSFFGDLSARLLGDALLEWLWKDLGTGMEMDPGRIGKALSSRLSSLTDQAAELVKDHPLPKNIPKLLSEVLEQKRAIGSEAMFACGRLDLPGGQFSNGRLVLAWMGDSRLRMWGPSGERTSELGNTFYTKERWSTNQGTVSGQPHIYISALQQGAEQGLTSVVAYSDGLEALDSLPSPPADRQMMDIIEQASQAATSDDISFLEVQLAGRGEPPKAMLRVPQTAQTTSKATTLSHTAIHPPAPPEPEPKATPPTAYSPVTSTEDQASAGRNVSLIIVPLLVAVGLLVGGFIFFQNQARQASEASARQTATIAAQLAQAQQTATIVAQLAQAQQTATVAAQLAQVQQTATAMEELAQAQAQSTAAAVATIAALTAEAAVTASAVPQAPSATPTTLVRAFTPTATRQATPTTRASPTTRATPSRQTATPTAARFSSSPQTPTANPTSLLFTKPATPLSPDNVGSVALLGTLDGHGSAVTGVAFSPDGELLASSSSDSTVQLWTLSAGKMLSTTLQHLSPVNTLAFSPDGTMLACGMQDGTIRLWQIGERNLLNPPRAQPLGEPLRGHRGPVRSLAFSAEGETLASASEDKNVLLWSTTDWTRSGVLGGHTNAVTSVAFAPNGQMLASGSEDRTVRLWSLANAQQTHSLELVLSPANSVAFSHDGSSVISGLSGEGNKKIQIWLVEDGSLLRTLIDDTQPVLGVAVAPEGEILASGSANGVVHLWNVEGTRPVARRSEAPGPIRGVAFNSDGTLLAAGAGDGKVYLWGADETSSSR